MTCVPVQQHTCQSRDTRYHVAGQNVKVTGGQNQRGYHSVTVMVTTVVTIVTIVTEPELTILRLTAVPGVRVDLLAMSVAVGE